jgi:hypothetical protein
VPEAERGGYQYWLASNIIEFTSEAYRTVVYDEDNEPVRLPGYRVDALTDAAIRYVDAHRDTPFYLFLTLLGPIIRIRLTATPHQTATPSGTPASG